MRQIKFRGRDKHTDEWFYGNLYDKDTKGRTHICTTTCGCFDIDPDTIGQFTGLYDKNGKEIYEGDIVRVEDWFNSEVFWNEELAAFVVEEQENYLPMMHLLNDFKEYVVIGNIHDNPELLKQEQ